MARTRNERATTRRKAATPNGAPQSAEELLERYAAGERSFASSHLEGADFQGADLSGVNLDDSLLDGADFSGANLCDASISITGFSEVCLRGACLIAARFIETEFGRSDLSNADLTYALFLDSGIECVNFGGAKIGSTCFLNVSIRSLCDATRSVVHEGQSHIDYQSLLWSIRAPGLKDFLQRTGMPDIFVEYMVECARAMNGSVIKKLLRSTFISYGGPDEAFARKLYEALHRNGVTTFFFPEHAPVGRKIGRVVRENVEKYDRILLLCSKASLDRPGLLYEIEETLERERRDGGAEYLIPIELDDCLRVDGAVLRKDLVRVLRDRVCADLRGAKEDEEVFQAGLRKLIAALRPPDLALWRPSGSTKPTEP